MSLGGRVRPARPGGGVRLCAPEGVHARGSGKPGSQCPPAGACVRRGLGFSCAGGRARPTERQREARGLMFPGGRVRPPGSRVFVRRRACTPDGANASEIVS